MKNFAFKLLAVFVLASFVLSACGGGAAATEAPVVTEAPLLKLPQPKRLRLLKPCRWQRL